MPGRRRPLPTPGEALLLIILLAAVWIGAALAGGWLAEVSVAPPIADHYAQVFGAVEVVLVLLILVVVVTAPAWAPRP